MKNIINRFNYSGMFRTFSTTVLAIGFIGLTSVSCVRDSFERVKKPSDDKIAFNIKADNITAYGDTKSGAINDTIMLVSNHNDTLYLVVSASRNNDMKLGESAYITKGQPITSDNMPELYSKFNVVAYPFGTVASPYLTELAEYDSSSKEWNTSKNYFWPDESSLDFYAYAPVEGVPGLTDIAYPESGLMTFSYQLPEGGQTSGTGSHIDAQNQKDILFAITKNKNKYSDDGYVSFTFEHALAAIKFVAGKIVTAGTIQSITLKNLSSNGDASFDGETHSFEWTNQDTQSNTYSQTFDVSLNKQTAAQDITNTDVKTTFMMIPQVIDGVTSIIEINYVKEGESTPTVFSVAIPKIEWKAGYTYTYKVGIDDSEVKVDVDDRVTDNVKDQLVVANTGESDAYLRVAIVGFWKDASDYIIADWDETQGTFENFPGQDWIKGEDGFYYYTYPVNGTNSTPVATGTPLFAKYTAPQTSISGAHLCLDIIVQGVKYDLGKQNVTMAWGADVANLLKTK